MIGRCKVDVYISRDVKAFVRKGAKDLGVTQSAFVAMVLTQLKQIKEKEHGKEKATKYFSDAIYK